MSIPTPSTCSIMGEGGHSPPFLNPHPITDPDTLNLPPTTVSSDLLAKHSLTSAYHTAQSTQSTEEDFALNPLEEAIIIHYNTTEPKPPLHRIPEMLRGHALTALSRSHSPSLILRHLTLPNPSSDLPLTPSLDYNSVVGRNCDLCIGYVPMPVGITSSNLSLTMLAPDPTHPDLTLDTPVLCATTEGGLIASLSRGCKALKSSNLTTAVTKSGMSRSPCLDFNSLKDAVRFASYADTDACGQMMRDAFSTTSRFGLYKSHECTVVGTVVYLRVVAECGEAMGMNMVSKGVQAILAKLRERFDFDVITLSGNNCTDKKSSATNLIHGRGRSVTATARIPEAVVKSVLKSSAQRMARCCFLKCQVGSGVSGSMGGMNAHSANIVSGVFIATGQDPAHAVEGSMCTTVMEEIRDGSGDLSVSVTMPAVCVGVVGGGTNLKAQRRCLEVMGCGESADKLASVVCGAVMAGEVSLIAALTEGHLVNAHMNLNRKK